MEQVEVVPSGLDEVRAFKKEFNVLLIDLKVDMVKVSHGSKNKVNKDILLI